MVGRSRVLFGHVRVVGPCAYRVPKWSPGKPGLTNLPSTRPSGEWARLRWSRHPMRFSWSA